MSYYYYLYLEDKNIAIPIGNNKDDMEEYITRWNKLLKRMEGIPQNFLDTMEPTMWHMGKMIEAADIVIELYEFLEYGPSIAAVYYAMRNDDWEVIGEDDERMKESIILGW